ncbi:MAG: CaiB/BaiF CoA transferase family protein [Minwuia sp.]|uniref:CaiB/BaiF CoA transferase family protein n=1 Tax=Minwuia sp. TaxID=2493630 RepID=UPI003A8B14D7
MTGALSGYVVIEVAGNVASAYCGALLAACGAEVIKIEPPVTGDPVRTLPPFAKVGAPPENGGMHLFLNANKQSVVLDIGANSGRQAAERLVAGADVLVEVGLEDREPLGQECPDLIRAILSWFGQTGPRRDWRATDAVIQSMTGFIYPIGPEVGPPVIPGGYQAQITAGVTAFIAIVTALIGRESGDAGCTIDQSVLEATLTYTEIGPVKHIYDGEKSVRKGVNRFRPTYPQTLYPCAEGTWLGVSTVTPLQWYAACDLIGVREFAYDPRLQTSENRNDNWREIDDVFVRQLAARRAEEWFHEGQARRLPFALIPTMEELSELDHFQAREVFGTYGLPDGGSFQAPVIPWKFAATPLRQGGTAPRLGADTRTILSGRLGMADPEIDALAASDLRGAA